MLALILAGSFGFGCGKILLIKLKQALSPEQLVAPKEKLKPLCSESAREKLADAKCCAIDKEK